MGKVRKICGGFLGVLGVALFVIGVVVKWAIFPQVMEDLVYENLKLEDGTEGWNAFVSQKLNIKLNCSHGFKLKNNLKYKVTFL